MFTNLAREFIEVQNKNVLKSIAELTQYMSMAKNLMAEIGSKSFTMPQLDEIEKKVAKEYIEKTNTTVLNIVQQNDKMI